MVLLLLLEKSQEKYTATETRRANKSHMIRVTRVDKETVDTGFE